MKPVYISIDREEISGKYQVAIGDNAGGWRLLGPKFSGTSEELERRELTLRDAEAIRKYLDAAFPNQDKEALQKIRDILQRPASNQRIMQIAGPARKCLNIIKPLLPQS